MAHEHSTDPRALAIDSGVGSELARALAERDAANEDLLRFAYAASHDLAEPLRTIRGFAHLLQKECSDIGTEGQRFIEHILTGGERMQNLIDDLLMYSRAARLDNTLHRLNMSDLCDRAIRSLVDSIERSNATVTRSDLPTIVAVMGVRTVFECLLSNAIKFRGPEDPAVHVGAIELESDWEFSVSDNGIGIDPKYHERIFGAFERLNPRTDYQGSGVGLAIVKRIIGCFGGQVRVESELTRGSAFYFTVPKRLALEYEAWKAKSQLR